VLDALRGRDQSRIHHFALEILVHDFFAFLQDADHAVAFFAAGLFAEAFENFLQALDVSTRLFEMSLDTRAKFIGSGGLSQFRQSFHQTVFSVVNVLQFIDVKILQCVVLHDSPLSGSSMSMSSTAAGLMPR